MNRDTPPSKFVRHREFERALQFVCLETQSWLALLEAKSVRAAFHSHAQQLQGAQPGLTLCLGHDPRRVRDA